MIKVTVNGTVWEVSGNNEKACSKDIENNKRVELSDYVKTMFRQRYGCTVVIKKSILWKYDKELGIAYFCPNCKTFICSGGSCHKCGEEIDWSTKTEYKGKVQWE